MRTFKMSTQGTERRNNNSSFSLNTRKTRISNNSGLQEVLLHTDNCGPSTIPEASIIHEDGYLGD